MKLPKSGLVAELTATPHAGIHRYIYSGSGRYILIDLNHALSDDKVDQCSLRQISDTEICGMRRTQGWVENQAIHFYARFSRPIISFNDAERQALLEFAPDADTLTAAVGISAVSIEMRNLTSTPKSLNSTLTKSGNRPRKPGAQPCQASASKAAPKNSVESSPRHSIIQRLPLT